MKKLSIESEKLLEKFIKFDLNNKNMPVSYRCFSVTRDDINMLVNKNGMIKVDYKTGIDSGRGSVNVGPTEVYVKLMRENIRLFELIDSGLVVQHLSPFIKEYKETEAFNSVASEFNFMNDLSLDGYIYCYFLTENGRHYFKNKKREKNKIVWWDHVLPITISFCTFLIALLSLLKAFGNI